MPRSCVAYGCTNHSLKENKPGFFRFPNNNEQLRKKWITACKRKNSDGSDWNPQGKNVYICGEHFITGRPHKKDPNHPDYVPSVFKYKEVCEQHNKCKLRRFDFVTKRRKIMENVSNNLNSEQANKESVVSITTTGTTSAQLSTSAWSMQNSVNMNNDSELCVSSISQQTVNNVNNLCDVEKMKEETDLLYQKVEQLQNDRDAALKEAKELQQHKTSLIMEIDNLRQERDAALQEVKELKKKFIQYDNLKDKHSTKFKYYTGITLETFDNLFKYLYSSLPKICRSRIPFRDQLLMTLIKLRLNAHFENLADQFGLAKSSCHDVFKKWIDLMYIKLKFLIKWPDPDASKNTLPQVFGQYFPKLTGIIDCTEFFIDRPKNLKARAQVYSNYKKHSTVKFLIACTPHGSISFISKAWGGRVSDVELVKQSDFISHKYHNYGDQILADRGFTLEDEFAAGCGVELIIPYFTKGKKQLSAREVEVTRQIASIRVHIERVIGLLKNRYRILDGTLSTTLIKSLSDEVNKNNFTAVDKLVTVCSALCNLGDGIVYNDKNHMDIT